MTRKSKAKVLTRKQKKGVNRERVSEEEEMTKIVLIQKKLCVAENVMETLTEKLLLVEMRIMKLEETWFKLERKGLSSEVELFLVMGLEDKERKEFKPSTRKFAKQMEVIGLVSMLIADDSHVPFVRQETASDINNLMSGHKSCDKNVVGSSFEVGQRFDRATARGHKLVATIKNVTERMNKNYINGQEASCKNPSCELAFRHRCSKCLLVSYCSLQCSHLCWQKHKEAAARKVRKERRKEKRAVRKIEKCGDEEAVIQEVD